MFLKTIRDIAKPQVVAILDLIKRSTGLSVAEISRSLNMSYMGAKQYCLDLEEKGYLDTWRRPKTVGRPEITYRLTPKAEALFPQLGNELTLDILEWIQQIYGLTAAEKLLFKYFSRKGENYLKRLKGRSIAERAAGLARLREQEGYCAQVEYDARSGFRITEFHTPFREIAEKFPSVYRMEEQMFAKVLQTAVTRSEERASGLTKFTFAIHTLAPLPSATVQKDKLVLSN
ncbi:MAG: helix-turn-helix transcriptional regulator [Verrucomicrobiales bacterium]